MVWQPFHVLYPIWFATYQRGIFVSKLIGNIKVIAYIISSRQASLCSKANIANTLILLAGNNGLLPNSMHQLLINAPHLTNNTAHHDMPSLFESACYKNTLSVLHSFSSIFNAMDTCSSHNSWSSRPTVNTVISLPLLVIFNTFGHADDLDFIHKDSVRGSFVRDFLDYNFADHRLQFKPQTACPNPQGPRQLPALISTICP